MAIPETPEDIPRLFAAAWNAGDAHELASLFAEDAEFVNVVGLWWHNRADIERAHHYGLSTFFRDTTLSARHVKVRMIAKTVAIVHTRWKLSGQVDKDGKSLEDRITIMVFVAERSPGGWVVRTAQNTDIAPGMETNTVRHGKMVAVSYRSR